MFPVLCEDSVRVLDKAVSQSPTLDSIVFWPDRETEACMHCCSTHQCSKLYTHCRHCSPYTDQKTANKKIRSELVKIPKTDLHTITCRAKQAHVKRRQEYDPTRREGQQSKKRRTVDQMGNLQNFPCLTEEMFCCYACPVPEERPHRIQMAGIENSGYPEQIISLPNPNLLEPLVTGLMLNTVRTVRVRCSVFNVRTT